MNPLLYHERCNCKRKLKEATVYNVAYMLSKWNQNLDINFYYGLEKSLNLCHHDMETHIEDIFRYQLQHARYCRELMKRNLFDDYNDILPLSAAQSFPIGALLCPVAALPSLNQSSCGMTELFRIELFRMILKDEGISKVLSQSMFAWMGAPLLSADVGKYLYDIHPLKTFRFNRGGPILFSKFSKSSTGRTLIHLYHIWHTLNVPLLGYFHDAHKLKDSRFGRYVKIIPFRYIARNDKTFELLFNHFVINVMNFAVRLKAFSAGSDESEFALMVNDLIQHTLVFPLIPWLRLRGNRLHSKFFAKFVTNWRIHGDTFGKPEFDMDVHRFVIGGKRNRVQRHRALRRKYAAEISCGNAKCSKVNTNNAFRICANCKIVAYCSRRCQKYDWNKFCHRAVCRAITDSDHHHRLFL